MVILQQFLGLYDGWAIRHPRGARLFTRLALPALPLALWIAVVARSGRWPSGDGPHVLGTSMSLALSFRQLDVAGTLACWWSLLEPHPPGAYLPATLGYLVAGTAWHHGHLLVAAVLLWLCWDGVRRLGGGSVGALFLACTPLLWVQAESYGLDLLAAACVVQAVSHLVASRRLSVTGHAVGWGAWTGAALMVKYTAPMFLVAPGVLALWWGLRGRQVRPLAWGLAALVLVAGPWYATHLAPFLEYVRYSGDAGNEMMALHTPLVHQAWWSADRWLWYPAAAIDCWGWPGLLALVLGTLAWRRRASVPRGFWPAILAAGVVGWLMLSQQMARQDRYLLSLFPLLAAVIGTSRIRGFLAPVALITLYGTAALFFTWRDVPPTRDYGHALAGAGQEWPWPQEAYQPTSLHPQAWEIDQGLRRLRDAHGRDDGPIGVLVDDSISGPGFGTILSRSSALGFRWQLNSVILLDPWNWRGGPVRTTVLYGTCADPAREADEFETLFVVLRPDDAMKAAYLASSGRSLVDQWSIPGGWEGRIYR